MNPLAISSHSTEHKSNRWRSSHGFTLVEVLIAVVLTLIIILAMVRLFKSTGDSISLGRAKMDMHNQIRVVTETLRRDLQNATHLPNPRPGTSEGYFEIVEGPEFDGEHATGDVSFLGDHDDMLAMTVKSNGEPFRGRYNGTWVESYQAEVVWWVRHDDVDGDPEASYDESLRLYRRVMLIRPDLAVLATNSTDIISFHRDNDISARVGTTVINPGDPPVPAIIANTLQDLADRKNRFAHDYTLFPHVMDESSALLTPMLGDFKGQDLMLDNCVAFDVKVFDPTAEVFVPSRVGLEIGQVVDWDDPGFGSVITNASTSPGSQPNAYPQNGAYVNLGYDPTDATGLSNARWFAGLPYNNNYSFGLPDPWNGSRVFCSWFEGYESDGDDQDGNLLLDQGVDGIDNNNDGVIDDNLERETRPPYAYPVRSLEVRVRMIEKKSNLVLQQTVRESFVPN